MKKFIFLAAIAGFLPPAITAEASLDTSGFFVRMATQADQAQNAPPVSPDSPLAKILPHFDKPLGNKRGDVGGGDSRPRIVTPPPLNTSSSKKSDSSGGESADPKAKPNIDNMMGSLPPPPMLQAGGEIFSAIKMLEAEIKRDLVITEGEMTPEAMDKVRIRLAADLESKNTVVAALEAKYGARLSAAIDLIKKTVEMEKGLAASKSSSGEKRRTLQRRIEGNIAEKKEALAILKKEVGE